MKSVTEFASFTLNNALKTKTELTTAGKTPEEIQQTLGTSFKLEGDKLKYFWNALDVASQNQENLKRVLVVTLAEGENAPGKATKIEEHYYVPEFHILNRPATPKPDPRARGKGGKGGGRGGKGGGRDGERKGKGPQGDKPQAQAKPAPKTEA